MMSKKAPSWLTSYSSRASAARQIEPETIDVHLQHPIAQAVHDQLQHARMVMFSVLPHPVKSM